VLPRGGCTQGKRRLCRSGVKVSKQLGKRKFRGPRLNVQTSTPSAIQEKSQEDGVPANTKEKTGPPEEERLGGHPTLMDKRSRDRKKKCRKGPTELQRRH